MGYIITVISQPVIMQRNNNDTGIIPNKWIWKAQKSCAEASDLRIAGTFDSLKKTPVSIFYLLLFEYFVFVE